MYEMAALWDIVGKAASLAPLFRLDAITLIAVATSFLRFHEVKKECRKLEDRMQTLQLLLCSPSGRWIMQQQQQQQQQHLEQLGHRVTNALKDAHDLVESYNETTLFLRVRRGWSRSMARQFRDLRNSIDSYCGLILTINACFLILQANPPPSSVARTEVSDGLVAPSTGHSKHAESYKAAGHDTHVVNFSQE